MKSDASVNSFLRLLPHVWPHRRKVYLSCFFAVIVAILWGLNLSIALPLFEVLLDKKTPTEYIDAQIDKAQAEIDQNSASVDSRGVALEKLESRGEEADKERAEILRRQSRDQFKLGNDSRKLALLKWAKAEVIPLLPADQFDVLAIILGVLMLATVLKGIFMFLQETLIGSVVELTAIGVRKECFRRVLALDYQTVSLVGTPDLMSRFTYDMNVMCYGLRLVCGKVIQEPLRALVCIIGSFWICWQLTLLALLLAPVVGLMYARMGKTLKRASHRVMESMSRIYKTLEESFDGFKIVTAFNGAATHRRRFHRENKHYYKKALKIVEIDALTSPITEIMAFIAAFMALLPGCYLVLRETTSIWGIRLSSEPLTIGHLILLYMMLAGTIDPARKLSTTYAKLKRATAAADRIFELIDTKPLVKSPASPQPLARHTESIEFKNISFTYTGKADGGSPRPPALENVSLTIEAGEVVAVVGENGSGKSTLVNLLPRYYDPHNGSILIDGVDIRDVRPRELRNQIGVVTQETHLFDETISENIRYGKTNASRAEIEAAARQAHVTQFIDQLPDGFNTAVGDKGSRLSGGQRQRIALARAILRDPAILILDEATSAIDAQSEYLIHQTLREFVKGRTTFMITHTVSPSILDLVTKIIVMDRGRLIAAGPHETLISTCPIYQRLFNARSQKRFDDDAALRAA
ncbi:MAG: ABC transporter ATP-binding protein [Planctomycetaceae bacterium]